MVKLWLRLLTMDFFLWYDVGRISTRPTSRSVTWGTRSIVNLKFYKKQLCPLYYSNPIALSQVVALPGSLATPVVILIGVVVAVVSEAMWV